MFPIVLPIVMQLVAPVAVARPTLQDGADSLSIAAPTISLASSDTTPRRPRAIVYSDWYARRLTIHKIGAFASLPLYPVEYVLGDKLLHDRNPASWVKPTHVAVAATIGGIFAVNTVTGLWNLWDSLEDPAGQTRRVVHALTMVGADAGLFATALVSGDARESDVHRNLAITSMAVGAAGTILMWVWKD